MKDVRVKNTIVHADHLLLKLTLQSYDDTKLKFAEQAGDERQARKFRSSTDGPKAAEYLADLKERVYKTQDKVGAILKGLGHVSDRQVVNSAGLM